ncbi:hypothetical protein, partial [Agrobacterium tumefaciens]|uniref:hypothetical protein n=1 Tax=Agrobacterium tumefaciens TaxID=358 RepID=UPI001BA9A448
MANQQSRLDNLTLHLVAIQGTVTRWRLADGAAEAGGKSAVGSIAERLSRELEDAACRRPAAAWQRATATDCT